MLKIHSFAFNPYQENTYLVYSNTGECIIIDPGMSSPKEEKELQDFLEKNNLKPILLINTHCHIDHILGNKFVCENYDLKAQFHELEIQNYTAVESYAAQMGFNYKPGLISDNFLNEGDTISISGEELEVIFVPGHAPGHICLYNSNQNLLIAGDTLFLNSIGRTDLPGGNHQDLITNIQNKLYQLPDKTTVYPGHGPETNIGYEKSNNFFVKAEG